MTKIYEVLQQHVGGCREWIDSDTYGGNCCGEPAEYVLWGKFIPVEALGPRCYDHAAKHVGHDALASRSGWALINLRDLAFDLTAQERAESQQRRGALLAQIQENGRAMRGRVDRLRETVGLPPAQWDD